MIRRNYDITVTATAGCVLAILHAPWPLWAVWGGIVIYVAQGHIRGQSRAARHA